MHWISWRRQLGWTTWSCRRPGGIVQGTGDYTGFPQLPVHHLWFLRFTTRLPSRLVIHSNGCFSKTRTAVETQAGSVSLWGGNSSPQTKLSQGVGKQETSWFQSVFANPPKLALKVVRGPAGRQSRIVRRDEEQRSTAGTLAPFSLLFTEFDHSPQELHPRPPHTHKGFGKRKHRVYHFFYYLCCTLVLLWKSDSKADWATIVFLDAIWELGWLERGREVQIESHRQRW